jgi:hypothetical protein
LNHRKATLQLTDKDKARFWKKVAKREADECWEWTASTTGFGYGQFGAQGKVLGAHRVAYYIYYGVWPQAGRHTCDNSVCCNPRHVIDPTQPANVVRLPLGELHPRARLPDADIRAIRELYATGKATQAALAVRYRATQVWIGQVVRGERRAKAGGPITAFGRGRRAA